MYIQLYIRYRADHGNRLACSVIGSIVEFEDLKRLSGFERRSDVERWADEIGLPVKRCRGGIWTTVDALNTALGIATGVALVPYDSRMI